MSQEIRKREDFFLSSFQYITSPSSPSSIILILKQYFYTKLSLFSLSLFNSSLRDNWYTEKMHIFDVYDLMVFGICIFLLSFSIFISKVKSFILCLWRKSLINQFSLKVLMTDSNVLFLLGLIYILKGYIHKSEYINLEGVMIFHINIPDKECFQQKEPAQHLPNYACARPQLIIFITGQKQSECLLGTRHCVSWEECKGF